MRASLRARAFFYPYTQTIRLIQGAPCAGGVTPPQETFKRLAKPLSGVQAED